MPPHEHPDPTLGRYPVSIAIPVAWGEMDALLHVNNVVYSRWIESARVHYLARLGLMEPLRPDGVGPIVARIAVDFKRPVTYPDTVRVEATVIRIGRSSFTMGYRVWSERQATQVALGEDVMVVFDYQRGKPAPVDEALRSAIAALEGSGPAGR